MYACTHVVLARRALTLKYWQLLLLSNSSLHSESHRLPPTRAATSRPPSEPRCRLRTSFLRAALPSPCAPPSEPRCRPPALPPSRAAVPRPSLRAALPSPKPHCRLLPALQGRAAAWSPPPSHTSRSSRSAGRTPPPLLYQVRTKMHNIIYTSGCLSAQCCNLNLF